MRKIPSYTWDLILKEKVPRTIILLNLLTEEFEAEKKAMKKSQRKGRKK
tara:strand:+ start:503 stop:649 length:147 start_codon:yes stop_codon:yes gene_type:complete